MAEPKHMSRFYSAFDQFLKEASPKEAMTATATAFVSLVVSFVGAKGGDVSLPITINGGDQRDITIHPPKERPNDQ